RHGLDLDDWNLDHRSAEVDQLSSERIDLVAGARDQDAPSMQQTLRHRVQTLRHLDARPQDQQGVTSQAVRGRLSRQLAERSADAVLTRLARVEDQRSR